MQREEEAPGNELQRKKRAEAEELMCIMRKMYPRPFMGVMPNAVPRLRIKKNSGEIFWDETLTGAILVTLHAPTALEFDNAYLHGKMVDVEEIKSRFHRWCESAAVKAQAKGGSSQRRQRGRRDGREGD